MPSAGRHPNESATAAAADPSKKPEIVGPHEREVKNAKCVPTPTELVNVPTPVAKPA